MICKMILIDAIPCKAGSSLKTILRFNEDCYKQKTLEGSEPFRA